MVKPLPTKESKSIVSKIGAKLSPEGHKQFKMGLKVEKEHGLGEAKKEGLNTNVTSDDPIKTGKIALIHINEVPDYYTRLKKMESEGKKKGKLKVIISKQIKN